MPGLAAHDAARVLALEGIACLLECEGIQQLRLPGDPGGEPLAVTLTVSIYVAEGTETPAREIIESLQRGDVVGEQWDAEGMDRVDAARQAAEAELTEVHEVIAEPLGPPDHALAPRTEGTTLRLLIVLVAVAVLIAWLTLPA
jgi:hypothetical protein